MVIDIYTIYTSKYTQSQSFTSLQSITIFMRKFSVPIIYCLINARDPDVHPVKTRQVGIVE